MKILIVSYLFPPNNQMGAIRLNKAAKYLSEWGHEVHVLTAIDPLASSTAELEIPSENVIYTHSLNLDLPHWFAKKEPEKNVGSPGKMGRTKESSLAPAPSNSILTSLKKFARFLIRGKSMAFRSFYRSLWSFPDLQVGWLPHAVSAGASLIKGWRPDVIYASGPPHTALVVAHILSRRYGIPWVAELRDLWVDNPYHSSSGIRKFLMARLERRVLSSAKGFVVPTNGLKEILRSKYQTPTAVVLNGFDPYDFLEEVKPPVASEKVTIVHMGSTYGTRRDPSPLFEALNLLGPDAEKVKVKFYGEYLEAVSDLARRLEVEDFVEFHNPVSHKESLKIQQEADVLFLLVWDNPAEKDHCPGKLFEYIGSRRPILMRGYAHCVAADLITQHNLGVVKNDSHEIKEQLRIWIRQKEAGGIPPINRAFSSEFTRQTQIKRLNEFLTHQFDRACGVDLSETGPKNEGG
jgi:glycosyltransferase involved in cell wall biosynthesis